MHDLCETLDELKTDTAIGQAIASFAHHTRIANMNTERDLALIKSSCHGKSPLVERICAAGMLSQVLRLHHGAGGHDPRGEEKAVDLVQAGVPLACASMGRSREICSSRSRGVFTYINAHAAPGELASKRRELAAQFYSLPQEEQAQWKAAEEEARLSRVEVEPGITQDMRYNIEIEKKLWGNSSRTEPVSASAVQAVLEQHMDASHQGAWLHLKLWSVLGVCVVALLLLDSCTSRWHIIRHISMFFC